MGASFCKVNFFLFFLQFFFPRKLKIGKKKVQGFFFLWLENSMTMGQVFIPTQENYREFIRTSAARE